MNIFTQWIKSWQRSRARNQLLAKVSDESAIALAFIEQNGETTFDELLRATLLNPGDLSRRLRHLNELEEVRYDGSHWRVC